MEHNTDRILWTVLVLAIGVALFVIFKPATNSLLGQTTEKIQAVVNSVNDNKNNSSSSNNGDTAQAVGPNLVTGTDQQYTMGYGIPNTTWQDGYAYEKLPTTITSNPSEILPQNPHAFWYNLTQGTTYTQAIWFETDATVKDLSAARITWYTYFHHDPQPAKIQKLGQNSYKIVSTYTWPGKTDNYVRLFDIEYLNSAFDFSTGTYLKFGKMKLEKGSVSTPYTP